MLRWNFFSNQKKRISILLLPALVLLLGFELVDIGNVKSSNFTQVQDCKTTASSVGLDIVLPIQAGGEQFQTGDWVYQTKGSDHTGKDLCALDFWDVEGMRAVAIADGKVQVAKESCKNNFRTLTTDLSNSHSTSGLDRIVPIRASGVSD